MLRDSMVGFQKVHGGRQKKEKVENRSAGRKVGQLARTSLIT